EGSWTCARCEMTIRWLPGAEARELPSTWSAEHGELFCLQCRRDRAVDAALAALDALPEDAPQADRQRVRADARSEFEIERDPERPDNQIAHACQTSTLAVRKARMRLHQRT